MALPHIPARVLHSRLRDWIILPLMLILMVLTLVPVGGAMIERVKLATASEDLRALAAAVTLFLTDTGEAPARLSGESGCAYRAVEGQGTACAWGLFTGLQASEVPLVGPKLIGHRGQCGYPPLVSQLEQPTGSRVPPTCNGMRPVPGWQNIADHLLSNQRAYPVSRLGGWQGPYVTRNKLDPWGNSYLILVQPLWARAEGRPLGVIISAGANGVIETDLTATPPPASGWPGGDDLATVVGR